jgi:hypothetical protein
MAMRGLRAAPDELVERLLLHDGWRSTRFIGDSVYHTKIGGIVVLYHPSDMELVLKGVDGRTTFNVGSQRLHEHIVKCAAANKINIQDQLVREVCAINEAK